MTTIIGVDFSGAKKDHKTWFVQGRLDDGILLLESVQPIRREDLYSLMLGLSPPAVAAMDFPFGLPEGFLPHIGVGDDYRTMDEIWPVLAYTDWQDLKEIAAAFVKEHGEPRRVVDCHYQEAKSVLHRVNPDMLPMTYQGAHLLSRWSEREQSPPMACAAAGATSSASPGGRHRHGDDAGGLPELRRVSPGLQGGGADSPAET